MRKGFTLIELLIVVTIIAILAGAAIPYVQEYIEDARISRARADLNEVKNALIRYELDKGTSWPSAETTITKLVGPYLGKAFVDPWGVPYYISQTNSVVISAGPDRQLDSANWTAAVNNDNINVQFRPPLALTKAYWIDADNSGTVTTADQFSLRFSRPLTAGTLANTDVDYVLAGVQTAAPAGGISGAAIAGDKLILMSFTAPAIFVPGRDSLVTSGANIADQAVPPFGPTTCLSNQVTIQALK